MTPLKSPSNPPSETHPIEVRDVTLSYGQRIVQDKLTFTVQKGATFVIMGGSGCGKSTLLRHLIGLHKPAAGTILRDGHDLWHCDMKTQHQIRQASGTMFQSGGLWSSMTLAENVAFPLEEYTNLHPREIRELCQVKLALVGLAGFENFYPAELSGGMQKRAGIARAMALDPKILFLDEPSAGLDPISARRLDELIIELRESLHTTIIVVTHELQSIFTIATDAIFLDSATHTMTAQGHPRQILQDTTDQNLIDFLTRGTGKTDRQKAICPESIQLQSALSSSAPSSC
ncbi:MAG: ATP-binding cassette domain-containing protein [Lentisphaerae bacterium]|jgi:phospholipid/cholesterol/gamma-HCH transport system ATP-binding protein|nr:ATP-binding cassette domain-containing protein [Lentisphaerota bacterium]